jgi:tryptophanyl-tRNA synthetase
MRLVTDYVQSKLSLKDDASPLDESSKSKLKLGLFSYPVLQAADILVHRSVMPSYQVLRLIGVDEIQSNSCTSWRRPKSAS